MRRAWLVVPLAIASATGLGYVHPFGNPRAEPAKGRSTLLQGANLPPEAIRVLTQKCADCHSSETRWPAYARLAPGSWLMERDIIEARKHLDLSRWEMLSADEQQILLTKIIAQAKGGHMPPAQYALLHWDARLTQKDVHALSIMQELSPQESFPGNTGESGAAERGRAVFEKRCTGCHSLSGEREGPRLHDVFGRKAGSLPGFDYSPGLKNSGIVWNQETLEKWLSGPDSLVPDTKMDFSVPKAQERKDLAAYFATHP
jgi:cytochrome c